ncbi:MAG: hypothetical protein EZS28_007096 [Streblomastix strix]|uniref:Uncharacterized protein n=1 Tax=Streblomastix strix TaxID=222440 RepID=A0A5J4WSH8_9EUKA|nr:MAG: hypothetical protein EZS28_007096 [Streblomastix strix]
MKHQEFVKNLNKQNLGKFRIRGDDGRSLNEKLLEKLYKQNDGEKAFNGNILKTFCQVNNITSFITDSKFTNHNQVVDSVIRTIRNGFDNDSGKVSQFKS